jgi:4a-hydroxytetrahydrobiopterin dehydratase
MRKKLDQDEISRRMASLPAWKVENDRLLRAFSFPDFKGALDFVNRVGAVAEELGHHPDIQLGWGRAAFEITTHDAGGITDNDFELARRIDSLAGALK